MSSKILQLAVGSRDLSQAEKKYCCYKLTLHCTVTKFLLMLGVVSYFYIERV